MINVMFICNEWGSSKGGLTTFNREFAVNLAKESSDKIKVHCYVCSSSEEDREHARKQEVNLITARRVPGSNDPMEWLKIPPPELPNPDIVVGHGRKFGGAAYFISDRTKCNWVHFVHVFCEDLGKHKLEEGATADAIADNEKKHRQELELCEAANVVVAVGSQLQSKYKRLLPDIKVITPGILEKFVIPANNPQPGEAEEFRVFMFGRGSFEDFELKGYDIIGKAVASLGRKFELTFVGSPQDEQRKIENWFLNNTGILRNKLTIRGYRNHEEMKKMLCEADLIVMPSRTEGFGLVALEAISAGVPVLISSESGIAKALKKVEGGMSVVVNSHLPVEWAKRIFGLSELKPEERHARSVYLREQYGNTYSWKKECERFEQIIHKLVQRPEKAAPLNFALTAPSDEKQNTALPTSSKTRRYQEKNKDSFDNSFELPRVQFSAEQQSNPNEPEPVNKIFSEQQQQADGRQSQEISGSCNNSGEIPREQSSTEQQYNTNKPKPGQEVPPEQEPQQEGRRRQEIAGNKCYSAGLRVVCGPDWNLNESDGEEGYVGTVVELGGYSIPKNMALVQWDLHVTSYQDQLRRVGKHGAFDLCILDSSPIGVKHVGVVCKSCKQMPILGTCWSCLDCRDLAVHLCTSCYMADEHNKEHIFQRKDSPRVDGIFVGQRNGKKKIEAKGIYPGAKVTRGPDWEYGNQDGGIGRFGTVKKITDWQGKPASAAVVSWQSGTEGTYRLGYQGKIDLKCLSASSGGYYYKKHLPILDQKNKSHYMSWMVRAENAKASRSALHKASISGQYEAVKSLLENGEDVDQADTFSLTPLHLAAWYGQESVVQLLLQHGANVNAVDRFQKTVLQKAERHNHQSIIQLLLKNNAEPSYQQPLSLKSLSRQAFLHVDKRLGLNLLQAAVFEGKYDTVYKVHAFLGNFVREMSFEKTASNAMCCPDKSAVDILASLDKKEKGHVDIEKFYKEQVEKHGTLTELHLCKWSDDAEKAVELVLNEGVDINIPAKSNRTPLLWASSSSSSQFIKTLIDLGADVNVQRTDDKVAPLNLAACWNNYMATRVPLEYGAHVNMQNEFGDSPLHLSANKGHFTVSQLLIDSGCNVNLRINTDKTPLYFAVGNKRVRIVKRLLESKADVNLRYNQDPTDRVYLVRGKERGRPCWHYVMVEKPLLGLFLKKTNGGSLDVADFGTILKSGWGKDPVDSIRQEMSDKAHALYKEIQGNTVLHLASGNNDIEVMELLVRHGADVNSRDAEGFTSLHIAAIRGNIQVVKKLVELKADVNLTTLDGKDAADLAQMNEETEIEEYLKSKRSLPKRDVKKNMKEKTTDTETFLDSMSRVHRVEPLRDLNPVVDAIASLMVTGRRFSRLY